LILFLTEGLVVIPKRKAQTMDFIPTLIGLGIGVVLVMATCIHDFMLGYSDADKPEMGMRWGDSGPFFHWVYELGWESKRRRNEMASPSVSP
jgi:hypothetical protein